MPSAAPLIKVSVNIWVILSALTTKFKRFVKEVVKTANRDVFIYLLGKRHFSVYCWLDFFKIYYLFFSISYKACCFKNSSIISSFLSWRNEGDKTYLITAGVRYVVCSQSVHGSEGSLVFLPIRQKSRFWTTGKRGINSKCIRCPFPLVSQTKKEEGPLIEDYVSDSLALWVMVHPGHLLVNHTLRRAQNYSVPGM